MLPSSSLSESESQKSWGWKILWEVIWSVLFWSLDHLCGPSLDSLHYVPVSLLLRTPELDTVHFMRKPYFQWKQQQKTYVRRWIQFTSIGWMNMADTHKANISLEGVKVHPSLLTNTTSKVMVKWVCFLTRGGYQVMDFISRDLYIPQHLSVVFKICQK